MSLSQSPPALYLDGRGYIIPYILGQYLPTWLHDAIIGRASGIWRVAGGRGASEAAGGAAKKVAEVKK